MKQSYILSQLSLYASALTNKCFLTNIYRLCVAIDYCVLSFIECKLTLIRFMKAVVNAGLFFQKNFV